MGLDSDQVVHAALELLNKVGIDGLTTRRLAQELGIKGPTLYWHFKNKQTLIDQMVAVMLSPPFPTSTSEEWSSSLADAARRARRKMLSYRDGARVVATSLPTDPDNRDTAIGFLQEAGLTRDEALYALLLMSRFVVGWTLAEQALDAREEAPPEGFDPEAAFEFSLRAVMTGLKASIRPTAQAAVGTAPATPEPAA